MIRLGGVQSLGMVLGWFAGARLAPHIDQRYLKGFIIIIGLGVSVWLFFK